MKFNFICSLRETVDCINKMGYIIQIVHCVHCIYMYAYATKIPVAKNFTNHIYFVLQQYFDITYNLSTV